MFAVGAGGVHGWEIDIATYNIYLMVCNASMKTLCANEDDV
jgi:hypothetical protein